MTKIYCCTLLFDLDGVLIDSTPAVARVWRRWAAAHGLEAETVIRMAHGRPSRSTIAELLPDADLEKEDREVERMEMEDLEGVVVLPGARRLLASLPPNRWTIATSCTRPLAEVRLKAAGLPIPQTMITSSDVTNGKPNPEPYLKAAAKIGCAASDCVVVEDVPAGIRAGRSAGAQVIAFLTTVQRPELEAAGADWIVRDCEQIAVRRQNHELVVSLSL